MFFRPARTRPSAPEFRPLDATAQSVAPTRAYGPSFWLAYAGNTLVMVAVALLYRYADFITVLGGTEFHLGWIVGIGMVGALLMRLVLGLAIDHYGPGAVWIGSLLLMTASCFAHLAVDSCHTPTVYLLRILFTCALAGMFGASMTFVSARVPPIRVAELVGTLGTAGFIGIILGTQLGDLLLGTDTIHRVQVDRMFLVAGLLTCSSTVFAFLATRGSVRPQPQSRPSLWTMLRHYHPGMVLVIGIAMGVALGLPTVFLRTYTAELGIAKIGLFFGVYTPAAVATRLLTRRLPERFGTKPVILAGATAIVVGQFLFLLVRHEWQLIIPGICLGIAHGLIFPPIVGAGTRTFPSRHRGLAMTLIQGTWDMGTLIGAPAAGLIVEYSYLAGLPAYPTLFMAVAGMMTAVAGLYAFSRPRPEPPPDDWPTPDEPLSQRSNGSLQPAEAALPTGRQCV